MQLALTDEELNAFVQSRKVDPGQGLSLKKYQLPLLDSKLTYLSMLSTKSQNQLLELKTNLSLLNEEVDQARYFYGLTFQGGITNDNHARAVANVTNCYLVFGRRARNIVDLISSITL